MKRTVQMRVLIHALTVMVHRRLWLGGATLAALTVLMGMALLGLSGWFIAATALAGLLPATALVFDVFMPSAGIRLLALGRTASRYAERLVTHDATLAVLAALREKLFVGWAQPGAARWLQLRPARLLQRLTADVDALDSLYLRLLVPSVSALGAALLAAIILGSMRWWLGLVLWLWLMTLGAGLAWILVRHSTVDAARRAMALERLRADAVDLVAGQTELLMAGQLIAQCERLHRNDQRVNQADHSLNRLEAISVMAYGIAGALALAGVLAGVAWLVDAGMIGVPAAALALLVTLTAMEPFAALRRGALETGRTRLAIRRLGERIVHTPSFGYCPPVTALSQEPWAVQLHHTTVVHPGCTALTIQPVNLQIHKGERVALLGPSGAGKSTLLALIAGEISPAQGNIAALPSAWLTQRVELFQDNLRDNLRLSVPDAADTQLWAVLEDTGLAADIRALPHGLDTMLGEGGMGLSGGQARRLGLARMLLCPVSCWLLDEVTDGLDTATASDVIEHLAQRLQDRKSTTLIIATHLQREAQLADRLLWLEHGRICEQARRGEPAFDTLLHRLRPD